MARVQRGYRCSGCGWETPAYLGRCSRCGEWNTLVAYAESARQAGVASSGLRPRAAPIPLSAAGEDDGSRLASGIPELDRVLGGGLVPGSLVLAGGEPGIGKSTLMLQMAGSFAAAGLRVVYICGEESPRQVRMRAARLGLGAAAVDLLAETDLDAALEASLGVAPAVAIVDSVQSMRVEGIESRAGGPAQLAEAGARLVTWAKANDVATVLTGHVTKGGEIAGPRLLEHLVDVVLYFEGSPHTGLRVLRAVKNRYGATDEVGVFEMTGEGLRSVENASAAFLDLDSEGARASGCAVTAVMEGSRPLAVEVQALAIPSALAAPRRIATGLETSRLHVLLAVLAQRAGLDTSARDIVLAISGGLRVRDPAADLAVVLAVASALGDVPLGRDTAYLGEVALSGAVRPAGQAQRRLAELARLGFARCVAARGTTPVEGMAVVPVATISEAVATLQAHDDVRLGRAR